MERTSYCCQQMPSIPLLLLRAVELLQQQTTQSEFLY
jgi:hypothetical protein